jgi:hypothetical protein
VPGVNAGVHSIENQKVRNAAEAVEEIEPQCPSFDDSDLRRQAGYSLRVFAM